MSLPLSGGHIPFEHESQYRCRVPSLSELWCVGGPSRDLNSTIRYQWSETRSGPVRSICTARGNGVDGAGRGIPT